MNSADQFIVIATNHLFSLHEPLQSALQKAQAFTKHSFSLTVVGIAVVFAVLCLLQRVIQTKLRFRNRPIRNVLRLIFRAQGAMFLCACLVAYQQNVPLIGRNGISPARILERQMEGHYTSRGLVLPYNVPTPYSVLETMFLRGVAGTNASTLAADGDLLKRALRVAVRRAVLIPSLLPLWRKPGDIMDSDLDHLAVCGMTVGLAMTLMPGMIIAPRSPIAAVVASSLVWIGWALYHTIVSVGGPFYSFGWESQMLETMSLAAIIPLASSARVPSAAAWLFRWLIFRITIGAGLIKLRAGGCWASRTCLHYHFETQPLPSPLSFIFHFFDPHTLSSAVLLDFLVQLYLAGAILVPIRFIRIWLGGVFQAGFMLVIAVSGNFSFLNWLTVIPALGCFDDDFLAVLSSLAAPFSLFLCRIRYPKAPMSPVNRKPLGLPFAGASLLSRALQAACFATVGCCVAVIAVHSIPVMLNLLSSRQAMNTSYDRLKLVNTYGAFGSVGDKRFEVLLQVSNSTAGPWVSLELPCKPTTPSRRPCFCAPYQYRLDWQIWFLGFPPHDIRYQSWFAALFWRLLDSPHDILPLFDPSSHAVLLQRPHFARARIARYRMAAPLWKLLPSLATGQQVNWWNVSSSKELFGPVDRDALLKFATDSDLLQV